ncbi:Zinc finger, C2H2 domain and Zinc finger, C2H2-like domain-containing protein [Aphelenchoides fujianensis]|nr:Zinc finger, C2H2 domain and Zinc finger, C2H2-like domain-containing protein [Aphelenchoides fujianensis]
MSAEHLLTHFSSICSLIMDKVDSLNVASNECPICKLAVSKRKSLRQHIMFQHAFRRKEDLDLLVSSPLGQHQRGGRLIDNPGLLWKRKAKQAIQKPKAGTTDPDESDQAGARRRDRAQREDRDECLVLS